METIGSIFRERRAILKMTQDQAVAAAGLPGGNGTLSIIERGRMPDFDVACRFAFVLQTSPNELASKLGIKVWGEPRHTKGAVPVRHQEG